MGSTGSIGRQALEIVAAFPDRFGITALTAHSQVGLLAEQARRFHAGTAVIMREELLPELRAALTGCDTVALAGMAGLEEVAAAPECDVVLAAMVGAVGLRRCWQPRARARPSRWRTRSRWWRRAGW